MIEFIISRDYLLYPVFVFGVLLFAVILRLPLRWLLRRIWHKGIVHTEILSDTISGMVVWMGAVVVVGIIGSFLPHSKWLDPYIERFLQPVMLTLFLIVFGVFLAKFLISWIATRSKDSKHSTVATSLIQKIVRWTVYLVIVALILDTYNIKITTIIATLGIGGLALALALQDTLSNIFAGVYITIANQIRVGDSISFDGSNDGVITDIGWRTTLLLKPNGSTIIVPNNKLSQAIVINMPRIGETAFRASMTIGVSTTTNTRRALAVVRSVLESVQNESTVQELLDTSVLPVATLAEPKNGSIDITVQYSVLRQSSSAAVREEILHRLYEEFSREKITMA